MKKIILLIFIISLSVNAQNINTTAKKSSSQLTATIVANGVMAGVLWKVCGPHTSWACVMAAMTVSQAASQIGAKRGSDSTANLSQCYGMYCSGDSGSGDPGALDGAAGGALESTYLTQTQQKLNDLQGKLAAKGYVYDSSTNKVNTPDGKSADPSAYNSAAGMKAAGMTDAQIAEALEALAATNKAGDNEFKRLSKLFGAEGGGGGAAFKKTKYAEGIDLNSLLDKQLKGTRGIASTGVEGLQKNMGNDSIGVAGDNIFKMIHRRYENQRQKGEFVP